MNNYYKFIEEDNNIIHNVNSADYVIPEKGQHVYVKYKEYSVLNTDEIINYDTFERDITIFLKSLN